MTDGTITAGCKKRSEETEAKEEMIPRSGPSRSPYPELSGNRVYQVMKNEKPAGAFHCRLFLVISLIV
jgi:hypothetical protein